MLFLLLTYNNYNNIIKISKYIQYIISKMIKNSLFYCANRDTYPPFKNGLYMEEYFLNKIQQENPITKRKYIPALWTNFQIEGWFQYRKDEMQYYLDEWIQNNPSDDGYFTIVQYDDGPLLKLPENTVVYGACSGNIPLPLIYQDASNTLLSFPKKTFNEKPILCSFVGNITCNNVQPNVREVMFTVLRNNPNFKMIQARGWTPVVEKDLQEVFINTTIDSKFALAPRGYGRSSFRFFECFQLGTIPIYIWNDYDWLPFKNNVDYTRLCISIHVSQIGVLENILKSITEEEYNKMMEYYYEIRHLFELEGMCNQIIEENA